MGLASLWQRLRGRTADPHTAHGGRPQTQHTSGSPVDLKLRGAGEILGTRQSGLPEMRLADLAVHNELLEAARDDARLVIARDPDLQTERGKALRALLYLFRRDDAVRTLRAG